MNGNWLWNVKHFPGFEKTQFKGWTFVYFKHFYWELIIYFQYKNVLKIFYFFSLSFLQFLYLFFHTILYVLRNCHIPSIFKLFSQIHLSIIQGICIRMPSSSKSFLNILHIDFSNTLIIKAIPSAIIKWFYMAIIMAMSGWTIMN